MNRAIGFLWIWLVTMGFLFAIVWMVAQTRVLLVQPLLSAGAAPITMNIPKGADARQIAKMADASGAHINPTVFAWAARLSGKARLIQAGEYRITNQDRLLGFLDRLVAGDVLRYRITIPEGATAQDFLNKLAAQNDIKHTLKGLDQAQIIAKMGWPITHLEGWLFPDTYVFTRGTTDKKILQEAYRQMKAQLDAAWADRAPGLPLKTPYDALILASIVEKETGLPDERAKVAGVFINRLNKGMRLQTDPTVIYGVAKASDGYVDEDTSPRRLTLKQLRTDTPYNTYTRTGLPPTPIALPSAAALQAVTHPDATDALYFVANGTGGHTFSRTLRGHNEAVQKWRKIEHTRESESKPEPESGPEK